ncbi:MAG: undecaprenyl-diphosphate phosphatase [Clostridia bacterium]|nr:undecaprenyl-diphosphate phosphatase [Clostridia bacterium]
MNLFDVIYSIIYGVIQGVSEWLPISSTGHLLLAENIIPFGMLSEGFFDMFKVVIQLGSIIAVVVIYFRQLNPFALSKSSIDKKNTWVLWSKILVASVPAGIAGVLFEDVIDNVLSPNWIIAVALIVYGVLFIVSGKISRKVSIETTADITYKTALLMGCCQMLALIPGTSRSGSTILGAILLLGMSRAAAAEFSFFMAVPVMFGASALKLLKGASGMSGSEWGILLIGSAVSFVVSMFVIKFLLAYIRKHDFKAFGYYRIVLGALVLLLILFNVIPYSAKA